MEPLDIVVRSALQDFAASIKAKDWWGKEREAVSLFAFGYLVARCRPNTVLFDPAQIAIESRVPKPQGLGIKKEICKDLLIWPQPGSTCWSTREGPASILEWKTNHRRVSASDVKWLQTYSRGHPAFVGYAICLDLKKREHFLSCTRVQAEVADAEWLVID